MTKEEIKALVREKLATKRIILFGAGVIAEEFYEEHKDKLNISHCVSNIEKEWGEGAFLGELDVKKYRREEIGENDYIVVCGPFAFRTIELQLKADGYMMYEDYIESKIAAAVYMGKKIALFYGQCVLRDIYQCLIQVEAFNKEYAAIFTQTGKGQAVVINRILFYTKDICDLYVYTPKILDRDSVYSLSLKELPEDCRIVTVSNLIVSMYWPQIDDDMEVYNSCYLHSYNAKRNLDFYHTLYRREDKNINRMLSEGRTAKQIIESIKSDDFYSEKQVIKNFNISLKLVSIAEKGIDVSIEDYIFQNYKGAMLYQNYMHANKKVVWEYVRRLLKAIDVSDDEVNKLEEESSEHIHQGGDVPIYPSVIKHLQLEFADKDTKYEIMTGRGIEYMTFEQYTEHYIEYTQKTMDIMKMW